MGLREAVDPRAWVLAGEVEDIRGREALQQAEDMAQGNGTSRALDALTRRRVALEADVDARVRRLRRAKPGGLRVIEAIIGVS